MEKELKTLTEAYESHIATLLRLIAIKDERIANLQEHNEILQKTIDLLKK
jgi:hypothetical protein